MSTIEDVLNAVSSGTADGKAVDIGGDGVRFLQDCLPLFNDFACARIVPQLDGTVQVDIEIDRSYFRGNLIFTVVEPGLEFAAVYLPHLELDNGIVYPFSRAEEIVIGDNLITFKVAL